MCGIYKITNNINGKVYIGQSIDIKRRWRSHKKDFENIDNKFYRAIRKYGLENFFFEIVEEVPVNELDERESYWIRFYNSIEEGYNTIPGGVKGIPFPVKLSDEEINRIYSLLKNTSLSQKEIAKVFNVHENTIQNINVGKSRRLPNLAYPIREKVTENICPNCGKNFTGKRKYCCEECARLSQQKVERPERNELKKMIRESTFTFIGKKYGVSDNAIRKWCKSMNLPSKSSDIKKYTEEQWQAI